VQQRVKVFLRYAPNHFVFGRIEEPIHIVNLATYIPKWNALGIAFASKVPVYPRHFLVNQVNQMAVQNRGSFSDERFRPPFFVQTSFHRFRQGVYDYRA
jgi:hypothetical protein